jgi:SAM-dependent methyltransferase
MVDIFEEGGARMRWSGNTGKALIQRALLAIDSPTTVLDVGAVGTGPLDLWTEMPLGALPLSVTAIDSDAEAVTKARSLELPIELETLSGYDLTTRYTEPHFDLAVCTQVLEHVARPVDLLSQIAEVLRPGGRLLLTVDSAHYSTTHAGDPLWKRAARPFAARLSERYYDFGMTEDSLRSALQEAGFEVNELLHCNLGPLKPVYASLMGSEAQIFMDAWISFEQKLQDDGFGKPELFRVIYAQATVRRV